MVTDYAPGKRYRVGGLKPFVYLLPTSGNPSSTSHCLLSYTVDNGKAVVNKVNGIPLKLDCLSVSMSSEETFAGRFKFKNTVTAALPEWGAGLQERLLGGDYKAVVEDMDGSQYVASVDFTASVSWRLEIGSSNKMEVTFSCDSNFPSLYLEEPITSFSKMAETACSYRMGGAKELLMAEWASAYMQRDGNSIVSVSTSKPFAKVEWLKGSFSFTEEYDGEKYTDTLSFSIPLSSYLSYWHYNIIEFSRNRYVALFQTVNGNTFSSGFENGLFPSYSIAAGEGSSTLDTITIKLSGVSGTGMAWAAADGMDGLINEDGRVLYSHVKPFYAGSRFYQTFMCTGVGTAVYTLMEETTVKGEGLGRYWALEGHRDDFDGAGLDIVGEYDDAEGIGGQSVTVAKNECSSYGQCLVSGLPYALEFSKGYASVTVTVEAGCAWSVESKPSWAEVTPSSGGGGSTEVTFAVDTGAAGGEAEGDITISAGGGKHVIHVTYSPFTEWRTQLDGNGGIEYFCYGDDSYIMLVKWVSPDGVNWEKTGEVKAGSLVNTADSRCMQYEQISDTERWVLEDNKFVCEEVQSEEPEPPVVNDRNNLIYSATKDAYVRVNGNNIKLPAGEGMKAYLGSSISSMVFWYTEGPLYNLGLTKLDFTNLDLSGLGASNYALMFFNCKDLASVNFGPTFLRSEGVSQLDGMFFGCLKLGSVDMSQWNLGSVTTMANMFNNCQSITSITFPNGEIAPTGMPYAFANCGKLKTLDICSISAANLTAYTGMFTGTENLSLTANTGMIKKLKEGTYPGTMVFNDCTPQPESGNVLRYTRGNADNYAVVNGAAIYLTEGSEKTLDASITSISFNNSNEANSLAALDLSGVSTSSVTSMDGMFKGLEYLRSVNARMDTSSATSMAEAFSGCKRLSALDLSSWDTSKAVIMRGMFASCDGLSSLNLTNFSTGNVTDFSEMFAGCSGITSLDLSSFDTSAATAVRNMFYSCEKLESLNLEGFGMENVTDCVGMFENCYALKNISCTQGFKDWCDANLDSLAFAEYTEIQWNIVR